ncbi:MAG: ABC transporter permease subunit [Planctomycetota bacterium]|nr:ABC transporter permease subunit [Planctomycetota bacterium]
MGFVLTLLQVAVVLFLGYLLAHKAVPWIVVKLGRKLGFRMKATPITQKRIRRFKHIKRGYWSFVAITTLFVTSLFLEVLVNNRALVISYNGRMAFPAIAEWFDDVLFFTKITAFNKKSDFGQIGESEVDYRLFEKHSEDPSELRKEIEDRKSSLTADRAAHEASPPAADAKNFEKRKWEREGRKLDKRAAQIAQMEKNLAVFEAGDAWCIMPLYPYAPADLRHEINEPPPNHPSTSRAIPAGTDVSGRDLVPLMLYGFRLSLLFAILVAAVGYAIGVVVGGFQGYYGGWVDILSQRFVEIWGSIPFLFVIMILASLIQPTFGMLVIMLIVLRSWLGITYYVRGEFYREKAKDYVQAAIGAGVSDWKIITKHILPNSLVPVVTFAPFGIVAYISTLVSLDYLGFGLPPGTPSWGALLRQGLENVKFYPHLLVVPTLALAATLYCVVMIGEAVREAFDPKVFSRLR